MARTFQLNVDRYKTDAAYRAEIQATLAEAHPEPHPDHKARQAQFSAQAKQAEEAHFRELKEKLRGGFKVTPLDTRSTNPNNLGQYWQDKAKRYGSVSAPDWLKLLVFDEEYNQAIRAEFLDSARKMGEKAARRMEEAVLSALQTPTRPDESDMISKPEQLSNLFPGLPVFVDTGNGPKPWNQAAKDMVSPCPKRTTEEKNAQFRAAYSPPNMGPGSLFVNRGTPANEQWEKVATTTGTDPLPPKSEILEAAEQIARVCGTSVSYALSALQSIMDRFPTAKPTGRTSSASPNQANVGKPAEGVHQFATGAVRGTGANDTRFDLISPHILEALARTYAEGSAKYGDTNWLKGIPSKDLINHAFRHINLWQLGDDTEDHLAHALWNLGAVIHFSKTKPELVVRQYAPGFDPNQDQTNREPRSTPPASESESKSQDSAKASSIPSHEPGKNPITATYRASRSEARRLLMDESSRVFILGGVDFMDGEDDRGECTLHFWPFEGTTLPSPKENPLDGIRDAIARLKAGELHNLTMGLVEHIQRHGANVAQGSDEEKLALSLAEALSSFASEG